VRRAVEGAPFVGRLPLKPLYTVSELSAATGLSRARVLRMLRACHVEPLRNGRSIYVPLTEIRHKMEPLWRQMSEVNDVLGGELDLLEP
jgi:hypothetical protein